MAKGDDKKNFTSSVQRGRSEAGSLYDQFLGINTPTAQVGTSGLNNPFYTGPPAGRPGQDAGGTTIPMLPQLGNTGLYGERNAARGRADELYGAIRERYGDISQSGGINQADIDRLRGIYENPSAYGGSSSGGGGGGGGIGYSLGDSAFQGINIPGFEESLAGFRDFSRTGGVDLSKLEEALGRYRELSGEKGGFTDERLAGIQGDTGRLRNADYSQIVRDELLNQERTGGYTEADIAAIRRKAASSGSSIYSSLADQLGREKAVTGFSPGISGANFKLARQAAQDASRANMEAGIGLGDTIRQGKFAASSRIADLELAKLAEQRANLAAASGIDIDVQSLIDQTRLGAIGGIQQGQYQNQGLISSNRLAGLGGLRDTEGLRSQLEMSRAGGLDQYALQRAQLDLAASSANASRSDMSARDRAAMEQWLIEAQQGGRIAGSQGLLNLYGTSPAEVMDYNDLIMRGLGQRDTSALNWTSMLAPRQGRDWLSTGVGLAGMGLDAYDRFRPRNPSGGGTNGPWETGGGG